MPKISVKSPMIRLAQIEAENLPQHPLLDPAATSTTKPELVNFALTILDQGRALILPTQFNLHFKHHSQKASPPSNTEVEVLSTSVLSSDLEKQPWGTSDVLRPKPSKLTDEFWYARRSYHHNLSSKRNAPGTASWDEFVYGIRDNHSKHESDFTPTIFDAHYICDWNEQLNAGLAGVSRENLPKYTHATMAIYEMCHALPGPVSSRCFPVLVLTASVSPSEFIAVTVPVNITNTKAAFYSNKRNKTEGTDRRTKGSVTLGNYVAVERVHKYPKTTTHQDAQGNTHTHADEPRHVDSHQEREEEIEWVMATASDTRGAIPTVMQRMGVPGAIVKDVGLFLKWIHKVPDEEIGKQSEVTEASREDTQKPVAPTS